jgi:hypothetical protein
MWRAEVLGHPFGGSRRRGFEDIAVDAAVPEQTVVTLLPPEGADDLLEGMAKTAAKS